MFRHCFLIFWLMAASILWCSTGVFGKIDLNPHGFPAARTETYSDPDKRTRIYRVQEPEERKVHPNVLIYMHGSAGKEEQGMDLLWERGTFARLRALMNRWGWVYVCPRDAEFAGLLKHLEEKYAPQDIYLAGASGGGNVALWEAGKNPSAYAGLPSYPTREKGLSKHALHAGVDRQRCKGSQNHQAVQGSGQKIKGLAEFLFVSGYL